MDKGEKDWGGMRGREEEEEEEEGRDFKFFSFLFVNSLVLINFLL